MELEKQFWKAGRRWPGNPKEQRQLAGDVRAGVLHLGQALVGRRHQGNPVGRTQGPWDRERDLGPGQEALGLRGPVTLALSLHPLPPPTRPSQGPWKLWTNSVTSQRPGKGPPSPRTLPFAAFEAH